MCNSIVPGESDPESIYESRKLLIRQIQGQIAKQVHNERDSVSEYDSWSDLEDNFALAYEPIPLSIKLDTWRKMSKKEILRKVNSKKIRKDFEYMTHGEIVAQIEKMQLNAQYLSSKFGINHLMPHLENIHDIHGHQHPRDDTDTETEQSEDNISVAESFVSGKEIYLSRAEILNKIHQSKSSSREHKSSGTKADKGPISPKNNHNGSRDNHVNGGKLNPARKVSSQHDSWSSRASSILKDPEAIYVSRVELLKKINVLEDSIRERKSSERKSVSPQGQASKRKEKRQHDSWSSRASSILAAAALEAEQEQVTPILHHVNSASQHGVISILHGCGF